MKTRKEAERLYDDVCTLPCPPPLLADADVVASAASVAFSFGFWQNS